MPFYVRSDSKNISNSHGHVDRYCYVWHPSSAARERTISRLFVALPVCCVLSHFLKGKKPRHVHTLKSPVKSSARGPSTFRPPPTKNGLRTQPHLVYHGAASARHVSVSARAGILAVLVGISSHLQRKNTTLTFHLVRYDHSRPDQLAFGVDISAVL